MSELVYRTAYLGVQGLSRALDVWLRIEGRERIPSAGGAVIACNHVSYLDPFAVALAASRRAVRFPVPQPWFDKRVTAPMLRGLRQIPSTDGSAYAALLDALHAGEVVGLFAEATIAQSYTVQELRTGAVRLAGAAGVPLVPMAVWGTHRLWTTGRRNLLQRGVPITVLTGAPLHLDGTEPVRVVTRELRARMQALLTQAQRQYPDSGDWRWWQPRHLGGAAPTPDEVAARAAAEQ